MTKEEAIQFLQERDFCMKHLAKPIKAKGARVESCPECDAERARMEQHLIEQAIRIIRGQSELPPTLVDLWTACESGHMPPINERVWLMCLGFRETGKAGKENYCVGKPMYWKHK